MANEKQYRIFEIECRKDNLEDTENKFIVEGYATTFDTPYLMYEGESYRVFEKVNKNAFEKSEKSDVIFQYDHEGRVFARMSNKTLKLTEDEHGLKVWADLGGTDEGRKLYSDIKGGYITKMSFAFCVDGENSEKRKSEDGKTEYTRVITSISKVYDVSAVSIPANEGTEINARKISDEIEKRIEAETNELEEKNKKEKEERERLEIELSFEI